MLKVQNHDLIYKVETNLIFESYIYVGGGKYSADESVRFVILKSLSSSNSMLEYISMKIILFTVY